MKVKMTTWYCDRCGTRIIKSESRCETCNKMLYWQWDGNIIFGSYFPKGVMTMTKYEAKDLQKNWQEKLSKRYKKQGIFHYLKYILWGEPREADRRRRRATTEEMAEVFRRWGHKCDECGTEYNLTVDHIIPLAKGGDWNIDNLRPLCGSCNSKKGDRI